MRIDYHVLIDIFLDWKKKYSYNSFMSILNLLKHD